jgi:hypothetical protein
MCCRCLHDEDHARNLNVHKYLGEYQRTDQALISATLHQNTILRYLGIWQGAVIEENKEKIYCVGHRNGYSYLPDPI